MEPLSAREELPWYPSISSEKCKGCRTCFRFCRAGALVFNRRLNKPRLKYPFRCRVECRTCARFCPVRAISFPDETLFVNSLIHLYYEARPDAFATPAPHPDTAASCHRWDNFRFSRSACTVHL